MTDAQFEKQRFDIVKNYFDYYNILCLEEDLGLSISSSAPGLYHVFTTKDDILTHQYSISDAKLKEISKSLKLITIKNIFISTKLKSYEDKLMKRYENNPLDWEQSH